MSRRHSRQFSRIEVADSGSSNSAAGTSTTAFSSITTPYASSSSSYQRPSRRLLIIAAAALFVLVALLHQNGNNNGDQEGVDTTHISSNHPQLDWKKWSDKLSEHGLSKVFGSSQRITLIAMWDDDYEATYLPSFFTSAARNADAVDLLWINVMRQGEKCLDVSPYTSKASNIKAICISDKEDKKLISNYLCNSWKCTEDQLNLVDEHLETRKDPIHCEFKPLRGMIYREWIKTDWWAWVDADQIIGNFKDLWPWKTMNNFDIITISEWDIGNLYLRGQFTAFRSSTTKMNNIWKKYLPLSKPENLNLLGHGPLDEFDYSVFYSNTLKEEINWILIPRLLGADKFGVNKLISNGKNNFYVPNDMRRRDITILLDDRFRPKSEPGFGMVNQFNPDKWAVPVRELGAGDYVYNKPIWKWCDQEETRCTVLRESYWFASTLMRYKGQLLEYFDMRSRPRARKRESYFGIEEKLFLHFQEIKRREWFEMPPNGIGEDDIIEIREHSVVMWNRHTLETTFQAINPNVKGATTPLDEILAHDYWGINGTDEMRLPIGVEEILLD